MKIPYFRIKLENKTTEMYVVLLAGNLEEAKFQVRNSIPHEIKVVAVRQL